MPKTKLLIHSNAPFTPTGYGQQTRLFAPLLAEHYDVAISSFYGLQGARLVWEGIPLFPGLGDTFGGEYLAEHAKRHFGGDPRGGLVLTLMDAQVLPVKMVAQLNAICWTPVDHEPAPPQLQHFLRESAAIPIAMSKFGREQLQEFDPLYVPHGVDLNAYKPHDKMAIRRENGLPENAFLVGMVAANKGRPSRKGFQQAFQAFRTFRENHPDAALFLHAVMDPTYAAGEDLVQMLGGLGLWGKEHLYVADQYRLLYNPLSDHDMARIYSAMDVLLNPSMGEGFGVPVLEAQACGTPAIVTNLTAMPEVCGAGWKVPYQPFWTGQNSWQGMPDIGAIAEALESAYAMNDKDRATMARNARRHAAKYAVPKVLEDHFLPALRECEERIGMREPVEVAA